MTDPTDSASGPRKGPSRAHVWCRNAASRSGAWTLKQAILRVGGILVVWAVIWTLVFFFIGTQCGVSGVEFSPDRFAHRKFRYLQLPVLEVQITPRFTDEFHTPLEKYLHAHGYVPPTDRERWHFICGSAPGVRGWRGPARWLCHGLRCWGNESDKWITWSQDHPECARLLWPRVVALARREEYYSAHVLLKRFFYFDGTPAQFREEVQTLKKVYPELDFDLDTQPSPSATPAAEE